MRWGRPVIVAHLGESTLFAFRRGRNLWFYGRTRGVNRVPLLMRVIPRKDWYGMAKHNREVVKSSLLVRLEEDQLRLGGLPACLDREFSEAFPSLWEVLAFTGQVNGKLYEPGSLFISVVGGAFRVAYFHRASGGRCEFSAPTLRMAFKGVEDHLAGGKPLVPCQNGKRRR